eukprot:3410834-Prymnesium_polylepis.1
MATHERGRVLPQKAPTKKPDDKGHTRGPAHVRTTKESKIPIQQRACKQTIPNISSSITSHMRADDHKKCLAAWLARKGADDEVKEFLNEYYLANPKERMGTVSEKDTLYRVVEAMLSAGIPLNKVDALRPLLERSNQSLTSSTHLK